jgi:hypothetical protein
MLKTILMALAGLAMAGCMPEPPSSLLAPADPALQTRRLQPTAPTTGLKPFLPADPKDWQELNKSVTPAPAPGPNGRMPDMPGIGGAK